MDSISRSTGKFKTIQANFEVILNMIPWFTLASKVCKVSFIFAMWGWSSTQPRVNWTVRDLDEKMKISVSTRTFSPVERIFVLLFFHGFLWSSSRSCESGWYRCYLFTLSQSVPFAVFRFGNFYSLISKHFWAKRNSQQSSICNAARW